LDDALYWFHKAELARQYNEALRDFVRQLERQEQQHHSD